MKVKLESKTNPDFPIAQQQGLNISAHWVHCNSTKEASQLCQQFIAQNNLGGGNWTGGEIINNKKHVIAYVSYNGRIHSS